MEKVIIGVDAGCLGINDKRLRVGVYHMAKSMFEELEKIDKNNAYYLYSFYPIEKKILKNLSPNFKNIVVRPSRGWTKIWLPLQLLKDKPDIFLGLNQSLPFKLPMQKYKSIVVIHDLLFERYPKLYPGSFRKLHKESKSAAKLADKIIAPSIATKNDLEKFYRIPKKKIIVAYEGIRSFESPYRSIRSTRLERKYPYFLFVGALKPQKNVPMLLEAFAKLNSPHLSTLSSKQGEGDKGVKLFIVGGDKWKDKEIDKVYKALPEKIKKHIKFLGLVDDRTLADLYKNALAFICPSFSEGFGLTFLEALSFGVTVIGPKTGSVPEVVGDAGILIDPTDEKELIQAMNKMLNPKVSLEFKNKAFSQSKKFSWKNFTAKFLDEITSLSSY